MGQKVLIFIIKERDLENTTADKTRDKITSPGKPFSLPPPSPLPTSKSKPLLHSSPLSTPAGPSSVSAAGAKHCSLTTACLPRIHYGARPRGASVSSFIQHLSSAYQCVLDAGAAQLEKMLPLLLLRGARGPGWETESTLSIVIH